MQMRYELSQNYPNFQASFFLISILNVFSVNFSSWLNFIEGISLSNRFSVFLLQTIYSLVQISHVEIFRGSITPIICHSLWLVSYYLFLLTSILIGSLEKELLIKHNLNRSSASQTRVYCIVCVHVCSLLCSPEFLDFSISRIIYLPNSVQVRYFYRNTRSQSYDWFLAQFVDFLFPEH